MRLLFFLFLLFPSVSFAAELPTVPLVESPAIASPTPTSDATTEAPLFDAEKSKLIPQGDTNFNNVTDSFSSQFIKSANHLLPLVLLIAGILAVFSLVLSGLRYIIAAGNLDEAKKARSGVANTIIGIIIIVSAFYLVKLAVGLGLSITS